MGFRTWLGLVDEEQRGRMLCQNDVLQKLSAEHSPAGIPDPFSEILPLIPFEYLAPELRDAYLKLRWIMREDLCPCRNEEQTEWKCRNAWVLASKAGKSIVIYENLNTREIQYEILDTLSRKMHLIARTMAAAAEYSIEAEETAMTKLKSLVNETQWRRYLTLGMFLERGKKSGLDYIFRRARPTIVINNRCAEPRVLTCLCLHAMGYYAQTWCGTMVPTDDVITHLLMMRGDEHYYWRKSQQHAPEDVESDL